MAKVSKSKAKASGQFGDPPPQGWHLLEVLHVKEKTAADGVSEQWQVLCWVIAEGEDHHHAKVMDNMTFSESAAGIAMAKICEILALPMDDDDELEVMATELMGKRFYGEVTHKTWKGELRGQIGIGIRRESDGPGEAGEYTEVTAGGNTKPF